MLRAIMYTLRPSGAKVHRRDGAQAISRVLKIVTIRLFWNRATRDSVQPAGLNQAQLCKERGSAKHHTG